MRLRSLLVLLVAAAFATVPGCSCTRQPGVQPPEPYALCVEADKDLNWYDNRANTLFVRVFQLSSPDAFQQAEGSRLLAHDAMPPGLVGSPVNTTVYPATKSTLDIRLDPNSVALGVVAGYFRAAGMTKVVRKVVRTTDDDEDEVVEAEAAKRKTCVHFGANAILSW